MRTLVLCGHELKRASRSLFLVGMTVVAPLAISGIIALAMSGASPDHGIALPLRVVVHGVDANDPLLLALTRPTEASRIETTLALDPDSARAAVREKRADVTVIIDGGGRTTILHDPASKIAPLIVTAIVRQVREAERGTAVVMTTVALHRREQATGNVVQNVGVAYGAFLSGRFERAQDLEWPGLSVDAPDGDIRGERTGFIAGLAALILAAQIVFFSFFGGGYAAESVLRDIEEGTFPRLRTFPMSLLTILGGRALYVVVLVALQVITLLIAGVLLFDVSWGSTGRVVLAAVGLVTLASGFGMFVISFAQSRKQAGVVLGAVMTLLGAAGGLFTVGIPNMPTEAALIARFTPHGLAMAGFTGALRGAPLVDAVTNTAMCSGLGALCFLFGLWRFAQRER